MIKFKIKITEVLVVRIVV